MTDSTSEQHHAQETAAHSGLLAGSLVVAMLALLFLGWIATEVLKGETLALDNSVRAWLHGFATPLLTELMRTITLFGSTPVQLIGTPLVSMAFWRIGWHRRAILYAVLMGGGGILLWIMKLAFHRQRPEPYFGYKLPSSFSFPSGHALLSFCFFVGLAELATEHERLAGRKVLIYSVALLMTLAIGLSRIYLSVHYFTDVVAGYAAAIVWISGVSWTYRRISHRSSQAIPNRD